MLKSGKNYYEILGVTPDVQLVQLKSAYRRLVRKYHPDINPQGELIFKDITEAYEVLSDETLRKKYDTLNQQYIRLAADFDNYRKRTEAQKIELINMGLENALLKMIEVLDNFDRAKKAMEGINDCEAALKSFDVLYNQVFENLKKLGLEIINTENEKFDPNFHEAVMQTPNNEVEDQTILNELQKGYKLKDKVLRPTLVNVAVNS